MSVGRYRDWWLAGLMSIGIPVCERSNECRWMCVSILWLLTIQCACVDVPASCRVVNQ